METLDIYTIDDGIESVVIHDVRLLPFFMFSVFHNPPTTDLSHARHMYVPISIQSDNPDLRSCSAMLAGPTTLPSVRRILPLAGSQLNGYRQSVGSEPLDALAAHIWRSVGPSGRNKVHSVPFFFVPLIMITNTGLPIPTRPERPRASTGVL